MKKVLAGAACQVLLLTACTAFPNPFKQQVQPSFWGHDTVIEKKEVSAEAKGETEAALFGLTTQGNYFIQPESDLIPYIWNEENGSKIELMPANAEATALMQDFVERDAAQNEREIPAGIDLFETYLAIYSHRMPVRQSGMMFGGDYITVQDGTGMIWLIDAGTGKMYGGKGRTYLSAYDNTLLGRGYAGTAQVFLLDKEMDTLSIKDYSYTKGFDGTSCALTAASYLPDGSIAVALRDISLDMDQGEICKLLIERPDGSQEIYDLGRIFFGREPELIFSVDSEHILLANLSTVRSGWVYYIDCATGEVSFLNFEENRLSLQPYTNFLNEAGMVEFDGRGGQIVMVLQAMVDGQTIMLQDDEGRLLLLKPDTLEYQFLLQNGAPAYFPLLYNFTGNGYDSFCYMGEDRDRWEYYTLGTRE